MMSLLGKMKWSAFVAMMFAVLLSACSSQDKLIGKWKNAEYKYRLDINNNDTYLTEMEFFGDGTIYFVLHSIYFPGERHSGIGKYKYLDDKRIKIGFGGFTSIIADVGIADNTLSLTLPDGRVGKYVRVKE